MDDFEFQIIMEEGEGGELPELPDEEYLHQPMSFAGAEEACQPGGGPAVNTAQRRQNHHIYLTHTNLLPTPRLDTSWQQLYENICETSTADREEKQVSQDTILWKMMKSLPKIP